MDQPKTLNRNAILFMACLENILGSSLFAALFSAPISPQEKIIIGAFVLLIVGYRYWSQVRQETYHKISTEMDQIYFELLEQRIQGVSMDCKLRLSQYMERLMAEDVLSGGGSSFGLHLSTKFAIWIGIGLALTYYVIPAIQKGAT